MFSEDQTDKPPNRINRARTILLAILFVTAAYLFAWPSADVPYFIGLVSHLVAGIALTGILAFFLIPILRRGNKTERIGWILLAIGAVLGIILIYTGTPKSDWTLLFVHVGCCVAGGALLASAWAGRHGFMAGGALPGIGRAAIFLIAAGLITGGAWWVRTVPWQKAYVIRNPDIAPASMDGEGDGPGGPFFPSSGQTLTGKTVTQDFFLDSQACERCHEDIYKQWQSSMHHFSSFNNQWYRQSIVYMQDTIGVQSSKWCAGCHDAALFFPGNFNTPIAPRVHTPAAQAGIGCMVCHSLRAIKSTMGNGDYVLQYPALSKLVATKNPYLRRFIDFMIQENPEPHRRTFLKPFMRTQTAEYCSVCHKVHLDVPVNHYRWTRGFDDYDNWQASGVSGLGARSFYYPPTPQNCADCHMPLAQSKDAGNIDGFVHNHRFVAANTAVPFASGDRVQLNDTEEFLKSGVVRVDIFAVSPDRPTPKNQASAMASSQPQIETTFAVGEEAATPTPSGPVPTVAPEPVTAPLNRVDPAVRAGDTVRVDVVVRTLKVGHFFPGGTVDAFDCWLALKATDDQGRVIFWSGGVEDNGRGPVDPSAHFYRSLLIDAHGNAITRRNAWAARATVYAHLIPPGAADTVHFRLKVPKDEKGHLHLEAKLNYRKFSWLNTQFAFAGVLHDTKAGDVTPDYDDRKVTYDADLSQVSGEIKAIPDLPIVTMAQDSVDIAVLAPNMPEPQARTLFAAKEWQRWNDYGIGLLLQGDLKGAEDAFAQITKGDPTNPDGWVNVGRARVLEGDTAGARQVLEKALQLAPRLARANYFYATVLREQGDYPGALAHLRIATEEYPEDRVVSDDIGRVLFLQHKYAEAKKAFEHTLTIDPEDLEANYNLMLCYTGLGDAAKASEFETRYMRFKADEASQTLTGPYRQAHPDDNNERQNIHEHDSAPLAEFVAKPVPGSRNTAKKIARRRGDDRQPAQLASQPGGAK
ncbi:MAG TPA: tetratricopeptide repeat protein [Candidatus Limnocylindrales bacterium]|nr:tetratricopeptide repeat protein [Candidatus Limnocylindrales bacterium]